MRMLGVMSNDAEQSNALAIALGIFWGTVASLIATFVAERLKRPHVRFAIAEPVDIDYISGPPRPATRARFVRLKITNEPLPRFLRWLGRNALISSQARIDFLSASGNAIFPQSMTGRWA